MPVIHAASGHPISVKGVVLDRGRALLLRNRRGEWDLPGGRPDPDEDFRRTVERETFEESGAVVEARALIEGWAFEVQPQRLVWIVAWGCRLRSLASLQLSHEHGEMAWFLPDQLHTIPLPLGYARAIRRWARVEGCRP
jgi:8-oxo-dGTP pyrophosphatase MutT (NUDIX family)